MVGFYVALSVIERDLPANTPGIISFEFVRTARRAAQFLSEWGPNGHKTVRLSLWVDYGFMLSYGTFFTLTGLATRDYARRTGARAPASAGSVIPYFAAAAALFDAGENAFLLLILGGHGGNAAPVLATVCASLKFALIATAIAYVLWGLVVRLSRSSRISTDS